MLPESYVTPSSLLRLITKEEEAEIGMIKHTRILLFIFTAFLSGCAAESKDEEAANSTVMSANMPGDFDFKVVFGIQKNNEINTYEETVTKDLIAAGTATIDFTFSSEEMTDIYEKMKKVKITETKQFIPSSNCSMEPYSEDEWQITINGQTFSHTISEQYCALTADAKEMIELREYIFALVNSKEEFKLLPEAEGGYE